jgi:hypothetical protein
MKSHRRYLRRVRTAAVLALCVPLSASAGALAAAPGDSKADYPGAAPAPKIGDTPAVAAQHQLDMRSPDARDAARRPVRQADQHQVDLRSPDARDAARRPVRLGSQASPANPRPDTTPNAVADRGIAWATIGIGVAGCLLAVGAIAGIAGRTRRTARARITA